jgi:hypothetical protein
MVIHDIGQSCKATIMIEAAFYLGPQTVQRCGPVRVIRRTIRLEIIDTDI